MKKYFITIILSILVGFLLSNFILKEYDKDALLLPSIKESTEAYLIQQGVYSTMESMEENTSHLSDYIYSVIDNMYYVYIAMTLDNDNVTKLQEYYNNKGINTIVKTTLLNNSDFINELKQYDSIIKQTNDDETIKEVCKQVLSKYEGR